MLYLTLNVYFVSYPCCQTPFAILKRKQKQKGKKIRNRKEENYDKNIESEIVKTDFNL